MTSRAAELSHAAAARSCGAAIAARGGGGEEGDAIGRSNAGAEEGERRACLGFKVGGAEDGVRRAAMQNGIGQSVGSLCGLLVGVNHLESQEEGVPAEAGAQDALCTGTSWKRDPHQCRHCNPKATIS